MSEQPDALRLAAELEAPIGTQTTNATAQQAAAELRRLHDEAGTLRECLYQAQEAAKSLSERNVSADALLRRALGALKSVDGAVTSLVTIMSETPEPGAPADLVRSAITAIRQHLEGKAGPQGLGG